ncbi:ABC transporter ATP-binding protein [Marinicrinis lubricantis]|uniref:ABC transporter ATP-binding protein n=1 Tax=Marinicrinis lubricantis TaxID=2086470 RepID=A0ABW1ITV0_9BACL
MAETAQHKPQESRPMSHPPGFGRGPMHMGPKVQAKDTLGTLKRIWHYMGGQAKGLIVVFVLTLAVTGLTLAGPYLLGLAIDDYVIPGDSSGLLWMCLLLLAVYVGSSAAQWIQTYVMVGVSQRTVKVMRGDLFNQLQKLPLRFFDSKTHGELMSRTTNDMENVSNSLNQSVIQLMSSILTLVGALALMLSLDLWLTLLSLVTIPIVIGITKQIAVRTRKHFSGQQQSLGQLNGYIEEMVTGQKVVQVYRREEMAMTEFQTINDKLKETGIKSQIFSGMMGPVMNFVNNLSFALLAAVGGWMVFKDFTSIGVVVSFMNYSKQFGRPINELANQFNMLQSAVAGAERVFEVIDTPSEFEADARESEIRPIRGDVLLDHVTFSYKQNVPVLKNVSLHAKPGETIALVGPTGAGKTTIVNLLTRFYDIDRGTILIDGKPIQSWDKEALRGQLGIVLQDAYLFSATVRENIRYGRLDATDEEVVEVARLANADAFIQKLPQGYDTMLSAEGGNLSHGQRQLITIARAILANPSILILDEATSSIDTRTEMQIQEAMHTLMDGRTSFVIAHRLSTIRNADQILVTHGGEIIERGSHDELVQQQGFYYELYTSQFKRVG